MHLSQTRLLYSVVLVANKVAEQIAHSGSVVGRQTSWLVVMVVVVVVPTVAVVVVV